MFKPLRVMCVCVLSLGVVWPLFAGEKKTPQKKADKTIEKKIDKQVEKKPGAKKAAKKAAQKKPAKGEKAAAKGPAAKIFQPPKGVELTKDQKAQLHDLRQKYGAKIKEAVATAKLTKEQATARKEAIAKAKAKGLKGKQLRQAAAAATKLTEKQQTARDTIAAIRKEVQTSIRSMLTDDQKAKLPGKKKPKKAAK